MASISDHSTTLDVSKLSHHLYDAPHLNSEAFYVMRGERREQREHQSTMLFSVIPMMNVGVQRGNPAPAAAESRVTQPMLNVCIVH